VSRRANRQCRERRRARDRTPPDRGPFDRTQALTRWHGFLATATATGSREPLFGYLVLGPIVRIEPRLRKPGTFKN
jgi:hypothetical protein